MSDHKATENDAYTLGRDYRASARLATIQLLIHATLGYVIHPAISLPDDKSNLCIADVGTGTGIWLGELTRELPKSARLDGFDISDAQFPPTSWYGDNVSLSKLDIFKPLPEELKGKYDVAHLRYFMTVATDDTVQTVVDNLKAMLKPGGYLQWVERDWLSKFPESASVSDDASTQLTCHLKKLWSSTSWIKKLPEHFKNSSLSLVAYDTHTPLAIYRKPWNEDNLLGWWEASEKILDEKERKWFQDLHAEAAEDAAKGWYVDWELIVCVGKKEVEGV